VASLSSKHREEFVQPIQRVSRQLSQSASGFPELALGAKPCRHWACRCGTSEMELHVEDQRSPDVRLGKIFDRKLGIAVVPSSDAAGQGTAKETL